MGSSIGTNLSYDDAFDGRVSAGVLYRLQRLKLSTPALRKRATHRRLQGFPAPSRIGALGRRTFLVVR